MLLHIHEFPVFGNAKDEVFVADISEVIESEFAADPAMSMRGECSLRFAFVEKMSAVRFRNRYFLYASGRGLKEWRITDVPEMA